MNSNQTNDTLLNFTHLYSKLHGYISLAICLIGIPFNLFIIIILTKTKIASLAVNLILICIAINDSMTMIIYVPYCIHFYILNTNSYLDEPFPERDSHFWLIYSVVNICISITCHSISIWLTVYLAIYRYFYIKNNHLKLFNQPKLIILLITLFCFIYCSPTYFYPTINSRSFNNLTLNGTVLESFVYYMDQSDLDLKTNGLIFKLSFYSQALFAKIIPCILVVTFITLLMHSLLIVKQNGDRLKSVKYDKSNKELVYKTVNKRRNQTTKQNNRTNLMLLIVCFLFLITELPQAFLIFFSILNRHFYDEVYKPLGDLMDVGVLVNYSINFILYCSMSKAFRIAFINFFCLLK